MGMTQLRDGGRVDWAEYGSRDGTAAFYLHGGGSSSLEAAVYEAEAVQAGIRLIAPNRPSVAGSTPQTGFSQRTVADDIAQLADQLGLDRFVVAGLSNGGMFALAVAAVHPSRVAAVIAINPTTPLYTNRLAWELSPAPTRGAYEAMLATVATADPAALLQAIRSRPLTDSTDPAGAVPATAEPRVVELFNRVRDTVTPDALMREMVLGTSAWDFDPHSVARPVELVTGADDLGAPYAAEWVRQLPDARLHVVPGGHIAVLAPAVRQRVMSLIATAARR